MPIPSSAFTSMALGTSGLRHGVHPPQGASAMVFWSCSTVDDSRRIGEQLVFTGGRNFLVKGIQ